MYQKKGKSARYVTAFLFFGNIDPLFFLPVMSVSEVSQYPFLIL